MWLNIMNTAKLPDAQGSVKEGAPGRICLLIFAACCAVVAGHAIRRFWLSDAYMLACTIQDDSFYYILPAYNFHTAGFFTFDGHNPTYGFQPFYMVLLSMLGSCFTSLPLFFKAVLTLNSLAHIATALVIFLAIATALRAKAVAWRYLVSLAGGLMYLLNMDVFMANTTGKENPVAALILAAMVLVTLQLAAAPQREKDRRTAAYTATLGLLIGTLVICRILPTTLLLVATVCIFAFRRLSSRKIFIAAAIVVPLIWGLYALVAFGKLLPTSGAIKGGSFMAHLSEITPATAALMAHKVVIYLRDATLLSLGLSNNFHVPQLDLRMPPVRFSGNYISFLFCFALGMLCIVSLGSLGVRRLLRQPGAGLLFCLTAVSSLGYMLTGLLLYFHRKVFYYETWYIYDLPVLLPMLMAITAGAIPDGTWGARGERSMTWCSRSGPTAVRRVIGIGLWGTLAVACFAGSEWTYRRIQPMQAFPSQMKGGGNGVAGGHGACRPMGTQRAWIPRLRAGWLL